MEIQSVSPDGNYRLETLSIDFRMSHWVDRPRVTDLRTGEFILDLDGSAWDVMNYKWKDDGSLWMELRKYPGDQGSIAVHLHLAERQVTCPYFTCTAGQIQEHLDAFLRQG